MTASPAWVLSSCNHSLGQYRLSTIGFGQSTWNAATQVILTVFSITNERMQVYA